MMSTSLSVSKRAAEQLRRPAHDLAQLLLAQRRHVDLLARLEQRLVALQRAEEVGAHAHHHAQARVGQRLRKQFGEAPPLVAPRRARKAPRPDRRRERRPAAWVDRVPRGGARWRRSDRRASPCPGKSSIQPCCCFTRSGSVAANCQVSRKHSTSALSGSAPGLSDEKAPLPAVLKDRRPGVGRARVARARPDA